MLWAPILVESGGAAEGPDAQFSSLFSSTEEYLRET